MLVLSRHKAESMIFVVPEQPVAAPNNLIIVQVVEVAGNKVRLGVAADRSIVVDRLEIYLEKCREKNEPLPPCLDKFI